jgi:4-deoxy-L-threo-5-hexosulose-uronate ketol-isomerase
MKENVMDVRYSPDAHAYRTMTNSELRKHFLIDSLFGPDAVPMTYSDVDRSITGSAVPMRGALELTASKKEMAAEYFLERREIGIINIGGKGIVFADGVSYALAQKDCLYLGRGTKSVTFRSDSAAQPAKFYFVSFPAHATYPSVHVRSSEAEPSRLGSQQDANKRTINKYIHPNGVKSCQLVMGLTELEEGSVWNTMPVHTHQRRSEIYMYFNMEKDAMVVHLLGEPSETKHLIVRDGQAVISPSWSIHSGAGTRNYSFIWAMGGENQVFDDMDWVSAGNLQ